MDVYRAAVGRDKPHAAEDIRLRAEGLAVHEVAPAAEYLPDQQPVAQQVEHRAERYLLFAAHEPYHQHPGDDAAVNGEPAVVDGEYLVRVLDVVIQPEEHVV